MQPGGQVAIRLRLIRGIELMSLVGFDYEWYDAGSEMPSERTMVSMAGNAFSAFACGPFAMLGIAAAGRYDVEKPVVVEDCDEASDVSHSPGT